VIDWLSNIKFTDEQHQTTIKSFDTTKATFTAYLAKGKELLAEEEQKCQQQLDTLVEKYTQGMVNDEVYQEKQNEYTNAILGIQEEVREITHQGFAIYDMVFNFLELAKSASESYKKATREKRRELAKICIIELGINNGKVASIQGKPMVETLQKQELIQYGVTDTVIVELAKTLIHPDTHIIISKFYGDGQVIDYQSSTCHRI